MVFPNLNHSRPNISMTTKSKHVLNPLLWSASYRDYLVGFALQKVSDFGTAEDLVQETFLSAWSAHRRFRGECNERTWLTGILRNKIIDLYRKNGSRPSILVTDLENSAANESEFAPWIDRQADQRSINQPQAVMERSEFMRDLESAVTRLPETMGAAFRMREMQGYSTDEITRTLNISRSNLWVLIHRARQSLSDQLSPHWMGLSEFGEMSPV